MEPDFSLTLYMKQLILFATTKIS